MLTHIARILPRVLEAVADATASQERGPVLAAIEAEARREARMTISEVAAERGEAYSDLIDTVMECERSWRPAPWRRD